MSYDKPNRIKYSFLHDFGAGDQVFALLGPKGKAGRIYDYGVEGITEVFNSVTTAGLISVGSVADADLYADEMDALDAAVDTAFSLRTRYTAKQIADGIAADTAGMLLDDTLPADTLFALHCVGPTGGTPTGIGTAFVIVDWDD